MDYGFIVVHIPHASAVIPKEYMGDFLVGERRLREELIASTDAFCDELYGIKEFSRKVTADVSRLVCDVERFRGDSLEECSKNGRGLMYTRTENGEKLRAGGGNLRNRLLKEIYDPHHGRFSAEVRDVLGHYGKCLIIDGHSFQSKAGISAGDSADNPDFCIGTDDFHTPDSLLRAVCEKVTALGYTYAVNRPFSGSITPAEYYKEDRRVISIMFETNRRLYMNESDMTKTGGFEKTREACRALSLCAAEFVGGMSV